MLSFKHFLEEDDPNGELQTGMAASGANTVADDGSPEQKFMSKDKVTIDIKPTPVWKLSKGHAAHRGGAGTHADKRSARAKTRGNKSRNAIEDSSK
jgi:hypothetical protein